MKRKNPQLSILVGAPGSGKSTFAKYFVRTEENRMQLIVKLNIQNYIDKFNYPADI